MRARFFLAAALAIAAAPAGAEPTAAPGFTVAVVQRPGAIFAGLSRDGDALLLTDLASGRLYRRTADGTFAAFGPELPHGLDVIGDPTGPYAVARRGDGYVVAQGWTPVDRSEDPRDHALLALDAAGTARVIDADFWNPFAFASDGGTLFVVDSGRNTVERLDPGGRRRLATFPRIAQSGAAMQQLSPTEFARQKPYEVDAVPTGIALHDGRLFVTLFGGFPYVAGGGAVVSIDAAASDSGTKTEADGLNMPVGVAFDGTGRMLVLEHGTYDQATGFVAGSGRLVRVDRGGARDVLLSGLTRPAAVLVIDDAHLAVSELGGALVFLGAAAH
jgi:hypothetical protein